jgi:glycosyltransferase involved in cell wall biosynthesis
MKCGIGDYTAQLAEALGKRPGVAVAVLTDAAAQPVPPGLSYEVLAVARGWKWPDAWRVLRAARRWKPDIAHMQYPTQGYGRQKLPWLVPSLLAASGLRIVLTWHEYFLQGNIVQLKGSLLNLPNALLPGGLVVVRPNYHARMAPWYRRLVQRKVFQFIPNAPALPAAALSADERAAIRAGFAPEGRALIVFFGFVYPAKGVEFLFKAADPARHHLVLICDLSEADPYQKQILDLARTDGWAGHVTVTGFRPAGEVSRILAAADAAAFPFREGGGIWNTSLQGALAQGAFVLTTSRERHGFDAADNIYYARPDDVEDMRQALLSHSGRRAARAGPREFASWDEIADAHVRLYASLLA